MKKDYGLPKYREPLQMPQSVARDADDPCRGLLSRRVDWLRSLIEMTTVHFLL